MKKDIDYCMEILAFDEALYEKGKYSMEIFTSDKTVYKERKNNFIQEGLKLYKGAKFISVESYREIKRDFDKGNKDALARLFEESIADIIRAVAIVYARYDVEQYVPFEEGLSFVLEKFCKYLSNYQFLPAFRGSYNNVIMLGAYRIVVRAYLLGKARSCELPMKQSDVIWHIDKQESDEISFKDMNIEDLRNKLEKIIKTLKPKEQLAIKMAYGLDTGEKMSCDKIGKQIGISRSGAGIKVARALKKLQQDELVEYITEYSHSDLDT